MHKKLHQNKIFIVQKIKKRTTQCKKATESTHDSQSETKIEISLKKIASLDNSMGTIETNDDLFPNIDMSSPANYKEIVNILPAF
jgi:hypothetical protein